VELNLEPSQVSSAFREQRTGKASILVPAWVDEILAGC
jgi:NAD-dependent deacetylase